MTKKVMASINIDEKLKQQAKKLADKQDRSMNYIIITALKEYLERNK